MKICACGCALELQWKPHHKYHPARYIKGHQIKFARKGKFKNDATSKYTGYWRSKRVVSADFCEWEKIGSCKGMLDICHIDSNPLNNDKSNLLSLCRSHHRLMDNGKINPSNPIMPEFYIDRGGKRRYAKKS